jgi:hypothetical protein
MSFRPVDLQAALPRSYEVNRMNGSDAARQGSQQTYFTRHLNKEIDHDERFVKQSSESNKDNFVKRDGKGGQGQGGGAARHRKENKEAAAALNAYKSSGMVDIKV